MLTYVTDAPAVHTALSKVFPPTKNTAYNRNKVSTQCYAFKIVPTLTFTLAL